MSKLTYDRTAGQPRGYTLALSAGETQQWANRPDSRWPCSTLSGRPLRVEVDCNGLAEMVVDCRIPDNPDIGAGGELEAIVADHLAPPLRHLWPTWETL